MWLKALTTDSASYPYHLAFVDDAAFPNGRYFNNDLTNPDELSTNVLLVAQPDDLQKQYISLVNYL